MKRHLPLALASAVAIVSALIPGTVQGAFPGDNGKIAFVRSESGDSDIYVMNDDGTGQVNITNNAATDDQPAWSPDGTKIAFTSERSGNFEIWVMNADGSAPTRLTTNPGQFDWHPTWSPDGTQIAFLREGEGEQAIYKMSASGGAATEVFEGAWSPDWSPLGNKIAMVSFQDGDIAPQIYTVGTGGGNLARLTTDTELKDDVEWSPDGATIAYQGFIMEGEVPTFQHIYRVGANGLNQSVIYDGFNSAYPTWAPDGTLVAFSSYVGGNWDIYKTSLTGGEPVRLTTNAATDTDPDWQSQGGGPTSSGRIAFTSLRHGNAEIYTMDADGTGVQRLTTNAAMDDYPAWSPDGTTIAFTSWRDGNAEIYVMNADGTNETRLTNDAAYDAEPTWSGDGAYITFVSDRDGSQDIFVIESNGTPVTNLTQGTGSNFSPHQRGTAIVFVSDRNGNNDIYTMNSSGVFLNRLTTDPASEYAPALSPGVTQIVFTRGAPGEGHLYVMGVEGGEPHPTAITEGNQWEYHATWSPDSSWMAFTRAPVGNPNAAQIWVMDAEGIETQITDTGEGNMHPDWEGCSGGCVPVPNVHERTITLDLYTGSLGAKGKLTTTDGFYQCSANAPVKIQHKERGSWETVKTTTTNGNGKYNVGLGNIEGKFRAKAPEFGYNGEIGLKAVSPVKSH
jgi:Tol biopolymer transport system component